MMANKKPNSVEYRKIDLIIVYSANVKIERGVLYYGFI